MVEIFGIVEEIIQEELGKDGENIDLTLNNHIHAKTLNKRILKCGFRLSEARYAYIISRSIQDTTVVEKCMKSFKQDHLLEFIKWMVPLKRKGSINVCCLGGGSGMESIGIVDSLNLKEEFLARLKLHVTNIDIQEEWKEPFEKILDKAFHQLNKWKGESTTRFQNVDLMMSLSEETKRVIAESDVITAVKLMSTRKDTTGYKRMLKEVFTNMKDEAITIFVESKRKCHYLCKEAAMDPEAHMKVLCSNRILPPKTFKCNSKKIKECKKKYGILPNERIFAYTSILTKNGNCVNFSVNELLTLISSLKLNFE